MRIERIEGSVAQRLLRRSQVKRDTPQPGFTENLKISGRAFTVSVTTPDSLHIIGPQTNNSKKTAGEPIKASLVRDQINTSPIKSHPTSLNPFRSKVIYRWVKK